MKLGIIGSGTIVQEFLPKLIEFDGLEVVAIQGTLETIKQVKELCDANGVKNAVGSFEELCELNIDTVYVAVPNFLHYSYCMKAMGKGLNVIVEKPICSNYEETLALGDMARKNNLFIFEAITTLYLPNYQKIQEWLPRIGEIKLITSQYSQYSRRYDAFRNGEILPAFDPNKSGGALMDLNLYNLHYVMGLVGKPKDVKYYANIERDIDTSGVLVLNYDNYVATCIAAKDCRGIYGGIIQGTQGCIKTHYPPNLIGEVTLELNDGTYERYDDGSATQRLVPEFKAFIRAINENDYEYCYEMLDKSLDVSKVQTTARLEAGIQFPSDL